MRTPPAYPLIARVVLEFFVIGLGVCSLPIDLAGQSATSSRRLPETPTPSLLRPKDGRWQAVIPLNAVGVFETAYLNPRNPPNVLQPPMGFVPPPTTQVAQVPPSELFAQQTRLNAKREAGTVVTTDALVDRLSSFAAVLDIVFDNRTSNRTMLIGFTIRSSQEAQDAAKKAGARVVCKPEAKTCAARLQVRPREVGVIPLTVFVDVEGLKTLFKENRAKKDDPVRQEPLAFTVNFVEETEAPAQPRGYFSVVPVEYLGESDGKAEWSAVAAVSGSIEPDTGNDKKTFALDQHYDGERDRFFKGAGELRFKQELGARADADITVGFKDDVLGAKDQSAKLSANKYRFNVYARNGAILSFGKFTFAEPTNAVALKVKGEGFRLAYRKLAISHVLKRESATGEADHDNRDNRQVLVEANNLAFLDSRFFRSANVVFSYGRERLARAATDDDPEVVPHWYLTSGAELFFDAGREHPGLFSIAWYEHRARAIDSSAFARSSGRVFFGTAAWTWLTTSLDDDGKYRSRGTVTLQYGVGSKQREGDQAANEDHAYAGDQSAFGPDVLLLSGFGDKLKFSGWQGGLGGKTYASVAYLTPQFSPLEWIARPISAEIENRSTSVQWSHYTLRALPGTSADELSTTWLIETPAGIETTVQLAHLWPRGDLGRIFHIKPWSIVATVKATF